jgi:hypothetical protein
MPWSSFVSRLPVLLIGEILQINLHIRRLDDGAGAPCFYPPGAPAKVQTLFIDRPKGYFGFLTS